MNASTFEGLKWQLVRSEAYLNPKSMENNSPKHPNTAQKAIILHTFGVQVVGELKKKTSF